MATGDEILQCVWPITDDERTLNELVAEATPDLPRLATQAHAVVTGAVAWRTADADTIPGWNAYPGLLLVAEAPARRTLTPGVGPSSQLASVARLAGEGWSDRRIADAIGCSREAVAKARRRAGIPAGYRGAA